MVFQDHTPIANKWLLVLSGLSKNEVDIDGEKIYEQEYFRIPDRWISIQWSKTLIKQVIAYLGLCSSQGNIGVVDLNQLARLLKCSVRTLRNNNRTMEKMRLIKIGQLYGDFVHIQFENYLNTFFDIFEDRSKGEVGYHTNTGNTTIKKEVLFDMFLIEDVNALRIACRILYMMEMGININGKKSTTLTYNTFKGFLPDYNAYKPIIRETLDSLTNSFDINILERDELTEYLSSVSEEEVYDLVRKDLKGSFVVIFQFKADSTT